MKNLCLSIMLVLCALSCAPDMFAQKPRPCNSENRDKWMTEFRQYKRQFFTKELGLSRDQQNKFFPLYEEMEKSTRQIDGETRTMERHIDETENVTDTEYEACAEAMFDAKIKIAQVEREYMDKFKEILSPKQMFQLKGVERKLTREMVNHHNKLKVARKASQSDD